MYDCIPVYRKAGKKSIINYIKQTGAEPWILFYPVYPDCDMYDGVKLGYELPMPGAMNERKYPEKCRRAREKSSADIFAALSKWRGKEITADLRRKCPKF